MAQDACHEGARIDYPLSAVMETQAVELSVAEYLLPSDTTSMPLSAKEGAVRRHKAVVDALAGMGAVEADARLLALLSYDSEGKSAAVNMTVLSPSALMDDYIALLDRRGLPDHAAALRKAKALFPVWGDDPDLRYRQWSDGAGNIVSASIDAGLNAANAAFLVATPDVMDAAVALAATDPAYLARLETLRAEAADDQRLSYLMRLIWSCVQREWWTPSEADIALADLPRVQRDLLLADYLMAEVFNGGVHQYFTNSSGTLAPETADVLERMDLHEHGRALRQAMALYGADYPRDTDARRAMMQDWNEARDEALNAPTAIMDDGQVLNAMIAHARKNGLLPL
ncbi:MAG: DMP19 family protein [Paracoccaceae bacterium]